MASLSTFQQVMHIQIAQTTYSLEISESRELNQELILTIDLVVNICRCGLPRQSTMNLGHRSSTESASKEMIFDGDEIWDAAICFCLLVSRVFSPSAMSLLKL